MKKVFARTPVLTDANMHYCPGCTHGVAHRLVAEAIDELGVQGRTVGIAPVGCAVMAYNYLDIDWMQAAHGRAPAVATGIKRVRPESVVFTYQGDGDLAAIGTAEIVHAAMRNERITVIFINNATFGMTGGQMAPTTLIGQKTTTTPRGRDVKTWGYPLRVAELLAAINGDLYIARVSLHDPANVMKAKRAILKAFKTQVEDRGFSMVEVLSGCSTNLGISALEALRWVEENMIPYYPLGEFRTPGGVA